MQPYEHEQLYFYNLFLIYQLVDQVHAACDELQNSQMLVLVLEYLLAIGNHMNRNWSERNVTSGFQVSSMEKVYQYTLLFQQAVYLIELICQLYGKVSWLNKMK